jgi:hypothetical protein
MRIKEDPTVLWLGILGMVEPKHQDEVSVGCYVFADGRNDIGIVRRTRQ